MSTKNHKPTEKIKQTGFQSPAGDYVESSIDLNAELIARPSATFLFRSDNCIAFPAGIFKGDRFIVDRSIAPCTNDLVVLEWFGELVLRRLVVRQGQFYLADGYPETIKPMPSNPEVEIWGVVLHVIHSLRKD